MLIHFEVGSFSLFVVLWRFYDVVKDDFISRTWRIMFYGHKLGRWSKEV